ncbi:MAG: hypothetical protein B6D59_04840 [Campylobacteraceae bacterium 4484_4]|nr:MAG: hypothetical protein B6D59_04840 [Campylobacteraceae bacterium 4484_4]
METRRLRIQALFITDRETGKTIGQETLSLDKNGVLGDKHYKKEMNRSVLLTSIKAYKMAKEADIDIPYGTLGENILLDYDIREFAPGDQLQMGESVLEIVQKCPLCNHLARIDSALPKLLLHDRGIFAKVIKPGRLHLEDEAFLIA